MKTTVLIAILFAANVCHGYTLPPELDPLRNSRFGDISRDRETERLLRGINNPGDFSSGTSLLGNEQLTGPPSPSGDSSPVPGIWNNYLKKLAVSYPLEMAIEHPEQHLLVRRGGRLLVNALRSPWGAAAMTILYPQPAY